MIITATVSVHTNCNDYSHYYDFVIAVIFVTTSTNMY